MDWLGVGLFVSRQVEHCVGDGLVDTVCGPFEIEKKKEGGRSCKCVLHSASAHKVGAKEKKIWGHTLLPNWVNTCLAESLGRLLYNWCFICHN